MYYIDSNSLKEKVNFSLPKKILKLYLEMQTLTAKRNLIVAIRINKKARIKYNDLISNQKLPNNSRITNRYLKVASDMYYLSYSIEVWASHLIDKNVPVLMDMKAVISEQDGLVPANNNELIERRGITSIKSLISDQDGLMPANNIELIERRGLTSIKSLISDQDGLVPANNIELIERRGITSIKSPFTDKPAVTKFREWQKVEEYLKSLKNMRYSINSLTKNLARARTPTRFIEDIKFWLNDLNGHSDLLLIIQSYLIAEKYCNNLPTTWCSEHLLKQTLKVKSRVFDSILINKKARIHFNNLLDFYSRNELYNPKISKSHRKVAKDVYYLAYSIEVWTIDIMYENGNLLM
jgi:hypothetical protein